ncbi:MAG: hypothetical protein GKR89_05510 [Candidatus Latescibacteria bacterium]|nr:hypothetical protein [Candidatus Latescibacterota bacterium]
MRPIDALRSLWLLVAVAFIGGGLALFEYHQTRTHQHLQSRLNPRGHPQLQGHSLKELADVLLELYPERAQANILMGTTLAQQGRLQEARQHLELALKIERRNQNLLFLYARLLLDMGEDPAKVKPIVDDLRRYFPRSRPVMEAYFTKASKGQLRFEDDSIY